MKECLQMALDEASPVQIQMSTGVCYIGKVETIFDGYIGFETESYFMYLSLNHIVSFNFV